MSWAAVLNWILSIVSTNGGPKGARRIHGLRVGGLLSVVALLILGAAMWAKVDAAIQWKAAMDDHVTRTIPLVAEFRELVQLVREEQRLNDDRERLSAAVTDAIARHLKIDVEQVKLEAKLRIVEEQERRERWRRERERRESDGQ